MYTQYAVWLFDVLFLQQANRSGACVDGAGFTWYFMAPLISVKPCIIKLNSVLKGWT